MIMKHKVFFISIILLFLSTGTLFFYITKKHSIQSQQLIESSSNKDFQKTSINNKIKNRFLQLIKKSEDNKNKSFTNTLPQNNKKTITLVAVGDISYSRSVQRAIDRNQGDYYYPFAKVKDFFKDKDIVFGNVETAITPGRKIKPMEMVFRSDKELAKVLQDIGFNIVSLANNHSYNFGEKGMLDTFQALTKNNIQYIGAGKDAQEAYQPVYIVKNGIKVAFLAYCDSGFTPANYQAQNNRPGIAFMDTKKMIQAIKKAKKEADLTIVSMHSGIEYQAHPNKKQIKFAHQAIDAGADLVIGHHPHVIQNMEKYHDKYIIYSLGNFIFDQMWSSNTKRSLIMEITLNSQDVQKISVQPVVIENFAQPRLANQQESLSIIKRLEMPFKGHDLILK